MAKNKSKVNKLAGKINFRKNPKQVLGMITVAFLLVVAIALLATRNSDSTSKSTSTLELAKSTVNAENTKEIKANSPGASDSDTTSSSNPATSTSPSGSRKTTPSTSNSTSGSAPSSSNSPPSSTQPSSPASTPFSIESGPSSSVDNDYVEIGCSASARFTFTVFITATAAGTATYHWVRSDGATGANKQLVFSGAGTQQVTNTWDLFSDNTPGSYGVNGWQKVNVTSPNATSSKPSDASFTLGVNC